MDKYKLLLVDDEVELLDILIEYLEDEYDVISTKEPQKALQILENNSIDLILLDINMPDIDGIKLCKKIKKIDRYKDIPIIFLTAINDIKKVRDAFKGGAVDYLLKPFQLEELSIRIENHIRLSKKYIESYNKQIALNNQINELTKELMKLKNILMSEEHFQKREKNFSDMDKRFQEQRAESQKFNQKVQQIQEKLLQQQELLSRTKQMLS